MTHQIYMIKENYQYKLLIISYNGLKLYIRFLSIKIPLGLFLVMSLESLIFQFNPEVQILYDYQLFN